jgi:hypothetical protein
MPKQEVVVLNSASEAAKDALRDILDRLAGTPLDRQGDIAIEVDGRRYVVRGQSGQSAAASVERPAGVEVTRSKAGYRRDQVAQIALDGLAKALSLRTGDEFTLQLLVPKAWKELTEVEQRNAGKQFRVLLKSKPLGALAEWKTSDNEWHYRRE